MRYHVKLTLTKYAPPDCESLDDVFDGIFINENAELLFLYTGYVDESGRRLLERFDIPIRLIDKLEVSPLCE